MPSRWSLRKDSDSGSSRFTPAPLVHQNVGIDKEEKDRVAADKATEVALKKSQSEVKEMQRSTEKSVRAELDPKIADLEKRLKTMTTDRDTQKRDLDTLKRQMNGWITSMEKLHKERATGEERERKAAEERQAVADKLKVLDEEILAGLRLAHKVGGEAESGGKV
ncbi:hypothetical protein IAU60_001926 [Kwoniella sp. DSM 27419]